MTNKQPFITMNRTRKNYNEQYKSHSNMMLMIPLMKTHLLSNTIVKRRKKRNRNQQQQQIKDGVRKQQQ